MVPVPATGRGIQPIRHGRRVMLGAAFSPDSAGYFVGQRSAWRRAVEPQYPATQTGWEQAWRDFEGREPGAAKDYWEGVVARSAAQARSSSRGEQPVEPTPSIAHPAIPWWFGSALTTAGVCTALGVLAFVLGLILGLLHLPNIGYGPSCSGVGDPTACLSPAAVSIVHVISVALVITGVIAFVVGGLVVSGLITKVGYWRRGGEGTGGPAGDAYSDPAAEATAPSPAQPSGEGLTPKTS